MLFALPIAKQDFGVDPPNLSFESCGLAHHWKSTYNVAAANTSAALEDFEQLAQDNQLNYQNVSAYVQELYPEATQEAIRDLYNVLQI